MALQTQAALLDELMGIDRNSNSKKEVTWEDESVCKYYLAGFCPHELFVNTKMTLGECPKYHNSKLLDNYKNGPQYLKMGYEKRLKKFLEGYVHDVNKKIDHNVDRLRHGLLSGTEIAIKERIKKQERDVNDLVELIEEKANEGKIEESSNLSVKLEELQKDLKYDKIELQRQREFSREKMEDVCKICGAYISKTDPRNSMENHITGRIHCSYVRINEIIEKLDEILAGANVTLYNAYDYDAVDTDNHKAESVRSRSRTHHRSKYSSNSRQHHRDAPDNFIDETDDYYRSKRRHRSRDRHNHHHKSSSRHKSHRSSRDYTRSSRREHRQHGTRSRSPIMNVTNNQLHNEVINQSNNHHSEELEEGEY